MEARAQAKMIRVSPQKARLVVDLVRGKQVKEALGMFIESGRQDLIDATNTEITILEEFLPTQLTNDEIDNIIKQEIENNSYSSMKDMGKLMGYFKNNYSGQCDMGYVSKKIKEMLNG